MRHFLFVLLVLAILNGCLLGCGGGSGNATATGPLVAGRWAGALNSGGGGVYPAVLTLTTSGGQMTIACQGEAQFTQPAIADTGGHFSVTGTSTPCCTPVAVPTRFDGVVSNNVMTITLTNTQNGANLGTYTLNFGQDPPAQNVGCPG